MKKIILPVALIIIALTSCSHEDNNPTGAETASITAKFSGNLTSNATGKDVNRGTIPTTVNQIEITAKNNTNLSIPQSLTQFDLVGSGGQDKFYIDGVGAGNNTFVATAVTTASPIALLGQYDIVNDATTTTYLASQNAKVPYVSYSATTTQDIVLGAGSEVPFTMDTQNGRIVVLIKANAELIASNKKVTVAVELLNEDDTQAGSANGVVSGEQNYITYWSNENSVAGAYVKYVITIFTDATGTTVEKTINKTITVIKNTGISATETVTADGLIEDINYGTIVFPTWTQINQ